MQGTFGIEEEFILVDRRTLVPIPLAAIAIEELTASSSQGTITAEFLPSQIEHATELCRTPAEAWSDLYDFRQRLGVWVEQHRCIAAPVGTPFRTMPDLPELSTTKYRKIAHDAGYLTSEHLVNAMHVHVGSSEPSERIRVLNGLRNWLPLLLALSSNSPFWAGVDTAHHSWRYIQTRRWTTHGIPPYFDDVQAYDRLRKRLTGVGVVQQYCAPSWSVRLSEGHPTVEIRVCDIQLTPFDALAMALIVRALAHACADGPPGPVQLESAVLDAELWHAARHGLTAGIYNPTADLHGEALAACAALRDFIQPYAREQGAVDIIDHHLTQVVAHSTPAERQRSAFALGGRSRLAKLYRHSLAEPWPLAVTAPTATGGEGTSVASPSPLM